jgi:uncharacterized protein (DUF697 family)
MSIVKEVNFEEIRARAEQAPRILMISTTYEHADTAAKAVFGPEPERFVQYKTGDRTGTFDSIHYDAVIVWDPERTGLFDEVRKQSSQGRTDRIFFLASDGADAVERLQTEIVMTDPDIAPALGRWFIPFRPMAVRAIIDETAKANAQFAFVSNIPSIVPLFGGFISAGADLIVLTKNQVMMSYKLAATNGRNLHDQTGILRELAPVVGAGFVWRTVAREATSFLPLLAGTIPKVGIAFVGTYTVGRAVDYYYRFGKKPTREQMRLFSQQAVKLAASIPLPGRDKSDKVNAEIEADLKRSVGTADKGDDSQPSA